MKYKEKIKIVLDWYTNGDYPDILQNENGQDLEEILEQIIIFNEYHYYEDEISDTDDELLTELIGKYGHKAIKKYVKKDFEYKKEWLKKRQ